MFEQRSENKKPFIIVGLGEGLIAPIVELLISGLITAANTISSATGCPNLTLFFVLFALMDLVRNIVGCLLHTQYAIAHVIGSIFGIAICYSTISLVNTKVANSSLLTTAILTVSLAIRAIIGLFRWRHDRSTSDFGY